MTESLRALRDLASGGGAAQSLDEYLAWAAQLLARAEIDLPLLLIYAIDGEGRRARLVAREGLPSESPASPRDVDLDAAANGWPLAEALAEGAPLAVDDVSARFPELAGGLSPARPIERAIVLPIHPLHPRTARASAVVVAGAGPRLPMDEASAAFFELLAAVLSGGVASRLAIDAERRRADAFAERDKDKTAFFTNVSQEFRKRLSLMIGPIEDELGERDPPLPPGRHARLEIAHRNSLRLLRMVSAMLDFSYVEEGRVAPSFEPVDLVAATEDLATSFRGPIEKAGLRLSTRLEALPEPVYVDREMWTKIVGNLLSNAFKHTFRGGITVSLFVSDEEKKHVELRVDDTGTGIPARELPRMFNRFHRVKGIRSRADEGTGIGLALVRTLARIHGGDVQVVSRENLGSSFRVQVPRGSAHLPPERVVGVAHAKATDDAQVRAYVDEVRRWSEDSETATSPGIGVLDVEEPDGATGPRPRVLWGDDNADMRNYVASHLQRTYDVEVVADGEAAMQAVLANPPDLVLLDVMLPGRDGLALLRALRSLERTCLIPVILVSSRGDEDAALEGLDAGADDYIVKPFSAKALVARVRSCLELAKLRKDAADKLAEANKELEAFSYSVSHDLRAPLRAIDGFSKALAGEYGEKLDDEARRYLDRICAGTTRMAQLIDDLLSLSRITRWQIVDQPVDVTTLARRVLSDLAVRDPDRRVDCSVADGLGGRGDPRLVTVLLENLLGNAWKFSSKQADARIEVASEARDGETVFRVRDNGAGFDMTYAQKLFAPFQRLHTATEFPGTGIGLATVHRVVTRHGGKIWAESAPQKGATFFFTLGARDR